MSSPLSYFSTGSAMFIGCQITTSSNFKRSMGLLIALTLILGVNFSDVSAQARKAKPTLADAMGISAHHPVDCEKPGVAVLKQCKLERLTTKPAGYVVHHESGRILRKFLDRNGDEVLDQWSYYKDGREIYRDIDSNFDGKLDQYRWLGAGGTRWGLDSNQNGTIDTWKVISPEEVGAECFEAIKSRNQDRFNRLLLSPKELQELQLGEEIGKDVEARWKKARANFLAMARAEKTINAKSSSFYAGNGQPSMLAAGEFGCKRDLLVYDSAGGFFDTNGKSGQLSIGSLIKVGDAWRMYELPEVVTPNKPLAGGGALFPMPEFNGPGGKPDVRNEALSKLYDRLTAIDKQLVDADGAAAERLQKAKAETLLQFYVNTKDPKTKQDWLENLADSVASAYQADSFDGGLQFLDQVIASKKGAAGMDYVKWRSIFARYVWSNANAADKKDRDKANDKLIEELNAFQQTYPKSRYAGDALIQIAVYFEYKYTDEPEKAIKWYAQCQQRYPNTSYGRRAAGAVKRLRGAGTPLRFSGTTAGGKAFDLSSQRGKLVVLHYWEEWSAGGMETIAKLVKKYKGEVVFIGCNIEADTESFRAYMKKNSSMITWTQLHAPGSVDKSPLAHQLGVATEPLIVLIDKTGRLAETNIAPGDLDRQIERELRRAKSKK
ncbi:MAG: hypothetical protein AB8B55_11600 [Mariniblastus sp.]